MVYGVGRFLEVKLASVLQDKRWNWGPSQSEALVHVHRQFPSVQINDDNQAFWVTSKNLKYSCKATWGDIIRRNNRSKAEW